MIGGNLNGPIGNWASTFGRNNPFDINLSASLSGDMLSVSGTITDSDTPANQIVVGTSATVNPATESTAFGTSSGFEQPGTMRNFGVVFSNVMYTSTASIPEPCSSALVLIGFGFVTAWVRRNRNAPQG
jgi:hypothetical protein